VRILAIGSSTGGPAALSTVVPALSAGLPVPVVITQHMPPMFTRLLADRLNAVGPLPASEAVDGEPAEPGRVYVAPGGRHLKVVADAGRPGRLRLRLDDGPPENSCRPAVDVMFRTAADACGSGVLAVVLTGMGQDGMLGGRRVVDAGGRVIAQDQATSVVWGMPGAVVRDGLADRVLPLADVAAEVNRRVARATGGPAPLRIGA
ncbi:MAG TPA: CheB methylesterase domain-containing protein, partial [Humisphaera sp.]